jgi:hypothetical protein
MYVHVCLPSLFDMHGTTAHVHGPQQLEDARYALALPSGLL